VNDCTLDTPVVPMTCAERMAEACASYHQSFTKTDTISRIRDGDVDVTYGNPNFAQGGVDKLLDYIKRLHKTCPSCDSSALIGEEQRFPMYHVGGGYGRTGGGINCRGC
jgi:hypothetical protein